MGYSPGKMLPNISSGYSMLQKRSVQGLWLRAKVCPGGRRSQIMFSGLTGFEVDLAGTNCMNIKTMLTRH